MSKKRYILLVIPIFIFIFIVFLSLQHEDQKLETKEETMYDYCNGTLVNLTTKIIFCDVDIFKSEQAKKFVIERLDGTTDTWLANDTFRKLVTLFDNELYFKILITNLQNVSFYDINSFNLKDVKKDIQKLKEWKVSIAYRNGGEEFVYPICDGFIDGHYSFCQEVIERVIARTKKFENNRENCQSLIENYDDLVCSFP